VLDRSAPPKQPTKFLSYAIWLEAIFSIVSHWKNFLYLNPRFLVKRYSIRIFIWKQKVVFLQDLFSWWHFAFCDIHDALGYLNGRAWIHALLKPRKFENYVVIYTRASRFLEILKMVCFSPHQAWNDENHINLQKNRTVTCHMSVRHADYFFVSSSRRTSSPWRTAHEQVRSYEVDPVLQWNPTPRHQVSHSQPCLHQRLWLVFNKEAPRL